MEQRQVVVLGSTGSIGVSTLEVLEHLRGDGALFRVAGLAAGRNGERLAAQARQHGASAVALAEEAGADALRATLPQAQVYAGGDGARRLVAETGATDVVAAMVGSAGLPATLEAIRRGLRVALANKETLVAAGALVRPLARAHGAALLPVDSEHSAIFQCLTHDAVKRIVLTASGGPFRESSLAEIEHATVEDALKHPTWAMGQKITIDSATMMNKALEIIEAHWLFDLPPERIEVMVHPQSFVHSFVEFEDHSVLAQCGPPDMKTPIQYALTHPERPEGVGQALDWGALSHLDFEPPDPERFPALRLAKEVIAAGGTAGAVFNAANEAAVEAFLQRRIRFGRIVGLVEEALSAIPAGPAEELAAIEEADRRARAWVHEALAAERCVG